MKSLVHRDILGQHCNAEGCSVHFSETNRGKACSGCRNAYYCSSQCQKASWRLHKRGCGGFRIMQGLHAEGLTPDMVQDFTHFVTCTKSFISVIARSALRLGRPDSMAKDHWLQFNLHYIIPPRERWAKSSKKAYGDEHKLFRLSSLEVVPDALLDERKPMGVDRADKKKGCKRTEGGSDNSAIFFVLTATIPGDPLVRTASACQYLNINHTFGGLLPDYANRALNSACWALLDLGIGPAPKDEMENAIQLVTAHEIDLAMSQTLEYLEKLEQGPSQGWVAFRLEIEERMRKMGYPDFRCAT